MRRFLITLLMVFAASAVSAKDAVLPETIRDMDGKEHHLRKITDSSKTVALVFWQTWCASCRKEAPSIVAAAKKYQPDIQFFGVVSGTDKFVNDDKVRKYTKRLGLFYPQVRDRDLAISNACKVKGTPTIVLLGKDLKPLYNAHRSPADWKKYKQ